MKLRLLPALALVGCLQGAPPAIQQDVAALSALTGEPASDPWQRLADLDAAWRDAAGNYATPETAADVVQRPPSAHPAHAWGYLGVSADFLKRRQLPEAARAAWAALSLAGRLRAGPAERAHVRATAFDRLAEVAEARQRARWTSLLKLAADLERGWRDSPHARFANAAWQAAAARLEALEATPADARRALGIISGWGGEPRPPRVDEVPDLAGGKPFVARLVRHHLVLPDGRARALPLLEAFAADKPELLRAVHAAAEATGAEGLGETADRVADEILLFEELVARFERRYSTPDRELRRELCWSSRVTECLTVSDQACRAGVADACHEIAAIYRDGRGVAPDPARVAAAWRRACDAGDGYACRALVEAPEGTAPAADTVALLTRACDADDLEGCAALGFHYLAGDGVEADTGRAAPLFERSCAGSVPRGCHGLALVTESRSESDRLLSEACDRGVAPACTDLGHRIGAGDSASDRFRRGCEGGHLPGCLALGRLTVATDPVTATRLFDRACADGVADACAELGVSLAAGRGVSPDPRRARPLLEPACAAAFQPACHQLARLDAATPRAAELLTGACAAGLPDACLDLATAFTVGAGVPKDAAGALPLLRQACDAGHLGGCVRLATAYVEGTGTKADPKQAVNLYDQACQAGAGDACNTLASMTERGQGRRRNRKEARKLRERACELGHVDACPKKK